MKYIVDFFNEFITLTNEMSPFLLLGLLFAGVLHIFVNKATISKHLGKNNLKSVLVASLFGIPLPLCSCGVIPTGVSFHKEGASKGATVSFLISTPQTGVDSLLVTYSLMGLPFAIIRPVIAFITGIFGGLLTNYITKTDNKEVSDSCCESDCICNEASDSCCESDCSCNEGSDSCCNSDCSCNEASEISSDCGCGCSCGSAKPRTNNKVLQLLHYSFIEFLGDISKWLLIGLFLAAGISLIVPDDFFAEYIQNDFLSMIVVLLVSIPLYVCATSSVPIALVLLMKGISPGAAIVFLMAGPATNAATITVLGKSLGKKATISFVASIVLGAMFFGLLIDNFIPRDWLLGSIDLHSHEHHHIIPEWFSILSSIILMALIIYTLTKKVFTKLKNNSEEINIINKVDTMSEVTIRVKGMTCNHCKTSVEKNVVKLNGVDTVVATPDLNSVYIKGSKIDLEFVKQTINELGFECVD